MCCGKLLKRLVVGLITSYSGMGASLPGITTGNITLTSN